MKALDLVLTEVDGVAIGLLAHQVECSKACAASSMSVTHLAHWLGLPTTETRAQVVLSLVMAHAPSQDVVCSASVSLVSVAAQSIFPLPALLAARCQIKGLSAIAMHQQQPVFVIDLSRLTPVAC